MMTATMATWFIWDPGGMSPMESIDPVDRTDRPPAMSPIEFLSLIAWLFRPSLSSSWPTSVSVFHCCHPVLARPTVPNIDT